MMRVSACAGVAVASLLFAVPALLAADSAARLLEDKLSSHIHDYDVSLNGALGVAAIDLTTGRLFSYHGDAVFPTASTIKIPVLVEAFRAMKRGEFKLTDTVTLKPSDVVGGSGELQKSVTGAPKQLTVLELITAMIEHSDNTATNRVIAMVKMERVNRWLTELGFHDIRLRRIMMDSAAAQRGDENVASPAEMARLVEMLYRGKLADDADTQQMLDILKLVKARIRTTIPAGIAVASKPGDLPGVECEVGIVYLTGRPFVVSVYSTFLDDNVHPVSPIAKIVFDYFLKLSVSNEYGNRVH